MDEESALRFLPFHHTLRTFLVKTSLPLFSMADDDTIAYIYPAVGTQGYSGAVHTINMNKSNPGYVPPRRHRPLLLESLQYGPPDIFNRQNRETTEEVEEHDFLEYGTCIQGDF